MSTALWPATTRCAALQIPATVYAMPPMNTAGSSARRAGEIPSACAVPASITATCWAVSFSYAVSGEPATMVRPIAATAPGEAASRSTFPTAVADRPGDEVNWVPDGRTTGHHTPAATTPPICRAIWSAPAPNPIAGLVPGAATSLAGPLSSTVTVVSSRMVNAREICPAAVAVRPSTATNAPTPRIVPSMVSPARPGRCTIPATASADASRAASRETGTPASDLAMIGLDSLGQHSVADRDHPADVGRHLPVVCDHHDRESSRIQLVEQFHERRRVPGVQVPRRLIAQQQARPVH